MGSDEFFGCILKLFICDFSYNYSLVNILSSLLNVRNVNFYAKFNWWNRCVIWASGDQYSSRIFFYKKFKNASKKFVKSHEREIWILNGIFTKVASPPAVNSPLGSAKMNHVAANSSTLSASSEPQPAQPLQPPSSVSFGADPSRNVTSVAKFQVKFFDIEPT